MYGSSVIALVLNTENCTPEEAIAFQQQYEQKFQLPILLPLQQGVDQIVPVIQALLKKPL